MNRDFLTDEDVELEINRLQQSDAVKLAQRERRYKYRRRQYLYTLRWYEKRGNELIAQGITEESFKCEELDEFDEGGVTP